MNKPLVIIGAGPAGMIAALFAAQNGAHVTLLDSNAVIGRKLLVTGSGRANLTNRNVSADRYACADPAWMSALLDRFGHEDLLRFLESIGVLTCSTADGWYYPISDSAQTVTAAFDAALHRAGVDVRLEHQVTAIRKLDGGFLVKMDGNEDIPCERLIVAAGGKAYPTLGSRGELFPSLKALGHTVLPLVPALAPVTCDMKEFQKIQGVRLDALVSLFTVNDVRARRAVPQQNDIKERANAIRPYEIVAETTGNIIFTEWGLNGPGVMDLSHHIARHAETAFEFRLNFLPEHETAVKELIRQHRRDPIPLSVVPGASLPPKLAAFLIRRAGLRTEQTLADTSDAPLVALMDLVTALPVRVTGVRGFEFCQVSAGGVPVGEVDPATMQSKLVPGLYLAGETLDVVGPCGGYNLQFAFSSGAAAGMSMDK
jgi:predicted flavoprotein YhiN